MELQQVGVQHPRIKQVLAIQKNTAPNRYRLCVAEGLWAHKIMLDSGTPVDTFFWCPEAAYSDEAQQRAEQLAERANRAYRVSAKTLGRIAERGQADGLVSIAQLPSWDPERLQLGDSALVLVADGVEIPGNLGTLIRTLDACRGDCLLLTSRKTRLSHPRVLRASQGTSLTVPTVEFERAEQAMAWLRERAFDIYLADTDGKNYRSHDYSGRTALVVGSERYGVSKPWYQPGVNLVSVPMMGVADSLNVAISASVLLFEARAQKDHW